MASPSASAKADTSQDESWLEDLYRRAAEAQRRIDAERPVASLSDVLVRDPETGERRVFEAVTELQGLKIRFRPMTAADLVALGDNHDASPLDWSMEQKAGVLARNLAEPDLVDAAKGELTAEWLAEHLERLVVDDLVTTIYAASQPRLRVPAPPADEKKTPPTGADTSAYRASSGDSMTSDTRSSDRNRSTGSR